MKKKRLAAICLAAALLSGCAGEMPVEMREEPGERPQIAYVPIDDRTDNVERVVYLAESLGYELLMPPEDWYKTRLDDQPLNENGTQYGDRGLLLEWVAEQDAAGCDLFLLSVDQLFSGGLVNSRSQSSGEDILFSDGSLLPEQEAATQYLLPLGEGGENQVFLLDTVMRLAPTVGYGGGDLESYNTLRDYAAMPRPHLSGEALTVDAIIADYSVGADGENLAAGLPAEQEAHYLGARGNKLRLSDALLEKTAGLDAFQWIIGIDDSSSADSIQTNEIAYLKQAVAGRGAVLSGVDDLGTKAVCKLYSEKCGLDYTAAVRYFGGSEQEAACIYDAQPLEQIMDDHLAYFGVGQAPAGEADVEILVLTQPRVEDGKTGYVEALLAALKENQKAGVPTMLVNAGNGMYGQPFYDALTKGCDLGLLLGYSGFHDMAIVTGSTLSFGLSRYLYLRCGDQSDGLAQKAFVRTLVETVVKDLCYKSGTRLELIDSVRAAGGSPDNFYQYGSDEAALVKLLEESMGKTTRAVLKNFEKSNVIVGLEPYTEVGMGKLTLSNYRFPWSRVFEIRMDIAVGDFTAAH